MRNSLPRVQRFGTIRKARSRVAFAILRRLSDQMRARAVDLLLDIPVVVDTPNGPISFLNHGRGSCKRARTILTKEPDSLKWIDSMRPGSVFWDIGANVGVLTLYAAARGDLDVWAFEPAAVNYYNLVANCELNHFEKRVRCLQLGFSDSSALADLHVSQLLPAYSFTFKEQTKLNKRGKKRKFRPPSKLSSCGPSMNSSRDSTRRAPTASRSMCLGSRPRF
jgi:FkbM family methyltransferase